MQQFSPKLIMKMPTGRQYCSREHTHSHPLFLGNIHTYWKMSPKWASFQLFAQAHGEPTLLAISYGNCLLPITNGGAARAQRYSRLGTLES